MTDDREPNHRVVIQRVGEVAIQNTSDNLWITQKNDQMGDSDVVIPIMYAPAFAKALLEMLEPRRTR